MESKGSLKLREITSDSKIQLNSSLDIMLIPNYTVIFIYITCKTWLRLIAQYLITNHTTNEVDTPSLCCYVDIQVTGSMLWSDFIVKEVVRCGLVTWSTAPKYRGDFCIFNQVVLCSASTRCNVIKIFCVPFCQTFGL